MLDQTEEVKLGKKERVNPPYMFGTGFVRPEYEEKHVHARYTTVCKTDCHFMTLDRRHLHMIHERILKK